MNMNVALLREKLPQAAEQLKDAPTASPFERASAAYVANDYREAERLALQAAAQARTATPTNNADVIRAPQARWVRGAEANRVCHGHGASSRGSRAD